MAPPAAASKPDPKPAAAPATAASKSNPKPATAAKTGKTKPVSSSDSVSSSATAFFTPPSPNAGTPNIRIQNDQKLQLGVIYNRFKTFGEHALYIALALFAYGFITASFMTFFGPFSPATDAGDDRELKEKTKIFDRLDLLFPDDLEFSPYGFNPIRGLVDDELASDDTKREKEKKRIAAAYEADNTKNKYIIPFLVKLMETGGPNNLEPKSTVSEFPYTQFGLKLPNNETLADTRNVTQQNTDLGFGSSVLIWGKELMTCSLYFSYGRGRYYLKEFFKFLNLWMKKATPISANEADDTPEYTYIRNIVALMGIIILAFLTLVLLIWPSISLFIGAIKNTYTKNKNIFIDNEDANAHISPVTRIFGRVLILLFAAIIIMPIAMFNHVWQPLVFIGTILLYPISYSGSELKKIFIEIVPSLMALFVFGMIIAALYDLDQPVAIAVSVFMLIAYWLIFKDKINSLILFIGKIKTGVLGFRYVDQPK